MEGHSCLVFCASKAACEQVAKMIAACIGTIPERDAAAGAAATADTPAAKRAAIESGGKEGSGGGAMDVDATTGATANAAAAAAITPGGAGAMTTPAAPAPGQTLRGMLLEELRQMNADATLQAVVACGVAFHHRGARSQMLSSLACLLMR
jgi:hypothetical protein